MGEQGRASGALDAAHNVPINGTKSRFGRLPPRRRGRPAASA